MAHSYQSIIVGFLNMFMMKVILLNIYSDKDCSSLQFCKYGVCSCFFISYQSQCQFFEAFLEVFHTAVIQIVL